MRRIRTPGDDPVDPLVEEIREGRAELLLLPVRAVPAAQQNPIVRGPDRDDQRAAAAGAEAAAVPSSARHVLDPAARTRWRM